jgi:chlorobactene glucosyltransferase
LTLWETLLTLIIGVPLSIILLTAGLNLLFFLRLSAAEPTAHPFVSILVPARDEARVIGRTVSQLLQQTYPHFELIVLDDHSADDTAALARRAAQGDERLTVLGGKPLPAGWLGKNWACAQLAQVARGELLVFADADVTWQPQALAALVSAQQRSGADMVSIWPTQLTVGRAERLTVPLMALAILAYLPLAAVHYLPVSIFAAANGQCIALRRAAYRQIGGHGAVRDRIVEDVALAQHIKRQRLRLRLYDGNGLIGCRMYHSWQEVRQGFGKNILAGHANSIPFLAVSTLFHLTVFVVPWLWLLLALWLHIEWRWAFVLLSVGVGVRALTAWLTQQRVRDALLLPLSVLLMTRIALYAVVARWRGTTMWKGRVLD